MKKTFVCNESMIITIPIGNLRTAGAGQLMPERFHCVFRDSFKVFVVKGKPKPLGAVQAIAGVFLCTLGLIFGQEFSMNYTLPSVLFVVSGMVSYAAGQTPNMHVAKLSFSLNIISFFWSIVAFSFSVFHLLAIPNMDSRFPMMTKGICGLIMSLLVVENLLALFLIYWLSKAICREEFNTLPIILLKQAD
ncbi:uncharacterized protein LOC130172814 isoform X2 [Seriola aureovittata]|uniref:uncharacterized protein LOC130172814 isoform X2 n=1 Tax=Seriola aureovittata TaxID=2871759 RepID=UPI0024BDE3CA|nr:uncharacterized protein LOC130172814 isoform X2 [Seriola aureovittata]